MNLARDSLVINRKELERFTNGGLYPYTTFYLRDVKARTNTYWANHFSTIGIVGMNEACMNLIGKGIATPEGHGFALRALARMRKRLVVFQEETGDFFNLEATPAEGTSYRLALLDKKKFPDMLFANGESKVPYYTNSTHLPVNYSTDIFEALDLQDALQVSYTGGTVLHGFLGEEVGDTRAVRSMVRAITDNYRLPYFTLTPTFSICATHGYLKGEQFTCPDCGETADVYSRVVGYLRPVGRWNDGKQAEYADRMPYAVRENRPGASPEDRTQLDCVEKVA
jgi:ribonucleoside-triphosphate reductase